MLDHKHLIVNCYMKKPLVDTEKAIDWLRRLCDVIEMKIVAGPVAYYCDAHKNNGIAACVCLQTSHASIHVWDQEERPYARLDVYSCKMFDEYKVFEMLREFEIDDLKWFIIDRNQNESWIRAANYSLS